MPGKIFDQENIDPDKSYLLVFCKDLEADVIVLKELIDVFLQKTFMHIFFDELQIPVITFCTGNSGKSWMELHKFSHNFFRFGPTAQKCDNSVNCVRKDVLQNIPIQDRLVHLSLKFLFIEIYWQSIFLGRPLFS